MVFGFVLIDKGFYFRETIGRNMYVSIHHINIGTFAFVLDMYYMADIDFLYGIFIAFYDYAMIGIKDVSS